MTLTLERQDLMPGRQLIGGEWREASDTRRLDVTDPATDDVFASVPDGSAADARAAVDAAHAAFPAWRAVPAKQRAQILKRWNDLMMAHQEDLGRLISREQGKPLAEAEGRGRCTPPTTSSGSPRKASAPTARSSRPRNVAKRHDALKHPVGVVGDDHAVELPGRADRRKIAPALAAGCTVVCKPAEQTPLTSLRISSSWPRRPACRRASLNLVTARATHARVVDVCFERRAVRKISFTGSTAVGKQLTRRSADTLKRLILELGGHAPFIVFADADLDAAVEGLMAAKFRNGGQTCVCPNRVFVQSGVHDAFVDKLAGARRRAEGRPGHRARARRSAR